MILNIAKLAHLMYFACARLKKLVKLECRIECSIASFGSGNTTDSDHLRGEKVRIILNIAKIAHLLMYFA